jgi:flagellin-specific chaperone FliS
MKAAVEWLSDQIENEGKCIYEVIKQAKEMEKEQIERLIKEHDKMYEIMQALSFALSIDGKKDLANKTLIETANNAIQYYKETFKSE